jgi:hypothetical protein
MISSDKINIFIPFSTESERESEKSFNGPRGLSSSDNNEKKSESQAAIGDNGTTLLFRKAEIAVVRGGEPYRD